MALGLEDSSALNPNASTIELAVLLNLLPNPFASRPSSIGEVAISSESSIAEEDSFGGGNDHESRRWKPGSVVTRGGEPLVLPKRVEKLGFCEKEERRFGAGRGTGPGDEWFSVEFLSLREDIICQMISSDLFLFFVRVWRTC